MARRSGEAERTDTAARESATAETDAVFLASQRTSACVAISVAVAWFAAARWSLMEAGNLRRNNARKRESGAEVSNLSDSISAIIAEGILNPKIRKFDGNMGNGRGGERGGDRDRDLRLKGCGGGGVSHPKRNENCGLELEKAEAAAENEEPKDYLTCPRNGETVAGVKLDNNTASRKRK